MQFFEHQDQARGRTTLLLVLFLGAVIALVGASSAAAHFALTFGLRPDEPLSPNHWSHVALAGALTFGIILLGSAYRMLQLRGGGEKVAETLGGTLASGSSPDILERRVVNVVEEMAIAAGLAVPPVYILRGEVGINAFAAGWSPDDAVIGVTQGALEGLKRDQLQGVIAHEFSHILNRDCALNMRLMGVLHGIVLISIIGRILIRVGAAGGSSRSRNGSPVHFLVAGAAIWLFGSVGVLVARLIQSAVSRQREYLADASAVQFTRNPLGIGGALATIGSQSSALLTPRGGETSHMLIGEPDRMGFLSSLASHPPLFDRIRRVLPAWDGDFEALATPLGSVRQLLSSTAPSTQQVAKSVLEGGQSDEAIARQILSGGGVMDGGITGTTPSAEGVDSDEAMASAVLSGALLRDAVSKDSGAATPSSSANNDAPLARAQRILKEVPQQLRQAAGEAFSARALICAWVLDAQEDKQLAQLALLGSDVPLAEETLRLYRLIPRLDPLALLPLFDIAVGTMALLSDPQKATFAEHLESLRAQLSERSYRNYCLSTLALRHLRPLTVPQRQKQTLIKDAIETVLGVLAVEGHDRPEEALGSFSAGVASLGKRGNKLILPPGHALSVQTLDRSLTTLLKLPTSTRVDLLNAAESIAAHDGLVRPSEAELLRVLALCLGVAVPPAFAS